MRCAPQFTALCLLAALVTLDAGGAGPATRLGRWPLADIRPTGAPLSRSQSGDRDTGIQAARISTADALEFDRTNPVFWDNDTELDVFTLAFLLAAVSNGDIRLIGMSRSPNPYAPERDQAEFTALVRAAIDSGWRIPPELLSNVATDLGADYMTALTRPASGRIEDTRPIDRGPAQLMRDLVLAQGTARTPVIIGAGGPLTTVASAYLLAARAGRGEEFAAKAIVSANTFYHPQYPQVRDYNSQQDEWAVFIVASRLRLVIVPLNDELSAAQGDALWQYLAATPRGPMGDFIRHVQNDTWPSSYARTALYGDLGPILAVLYPRAGTLFQSIRRVRITDKWGDWPAGYPDHGRDSLNLNALKQILYLQEDASGRHRYVIGANAALAVSAFRAAFDEAFRNSRPTRPF